MMSRSEVLRAQPAQPSHKHGPHFFCKTIGTTRVSFLCFWVAKQTTARRLGPPKAENLDRAEKACRGFLFSISPALQPNSERFQQGSKTVPVFGVPMNAPGRIYWENLLLLNPPNKELQVIWLEDFYFMKSPVTPCPYRSILPCWGPERNKFHH